MSKLQDFRNKLEEIFEIDKADLDFGIYRIINQKRNEINDFLKSLEDDVKAELKNVGDVNIEDKKKELDKLKKSIEDLGYIPNENTKYIALKKEISESVDINVIESDIYSHLTTFFGRYYNEGDFISQRRFKDGVYALPYAGEEVKLHWANHDQYYIKTSENFNNYIISFGDKKLHFKVIDATTEKNNNKESEERRFFITTENSIEITENELIINFEYNQSKDNQSKDNQNKLNEEATKKVLEELKSKNIDWYKILSEIKKNKEGKAYKNNPSKLMYELNNYTAKNTFDYFIHKDLGNFLRRELDFYIKNEVMFIDDIDEFVIKKSIAKIKAIKNIGHKIIKMLEQLENFQKKLWEKKKFIVETNYCITLDKIPQEFWDEIIINENQIKEWKEMYDFDINDENKKSNNLGGLFNVNLSKTDILNNNKHLVIDTIHFSNDFKERLISSIDNLDEQLNGLLIHSENFQALNLLQEKYREKIKCIYIDPPYNSPSSEIIYKNNYKNSSWLSLMENRLQLKKSILTQNGATIVAIDKYEHTELFFLLSEIDSLNDVVSVSIEHNKKGTQGDFFSFSNEYAIFSLSKNMNKLNRKAIPFKDWEYSNLRNWGGESLRTDAANCFYPIFIKDNQIIGWGKIPDDNYHPISSNVVKNSGSIEIRFKNKKEYEIYKIKENEIIIEIYPIDDNGIERKWRYANQTIKEVINILKVETSRNNNLQIMLPKIDEQFKTLWTSPFYNAGDYGTKILTSMGLGNIFDFPKSIFTVKDCIFSSTDSSSVILDFFAGSGTTAHAVIELNREDGGNRKYILVEMGEYFDTVTKPRIKKVIYSKDWKDGMPVSKDGISQMFKYLKLEQYEDTLNNLIINKPASKTLFENEKFKEDYLLNYMIDFETKTSPSLLNIDMFENPFEYGMKIIEKNEIKYKNIDLIETFNYLIGLNINQNVKTRYFTFEDKNLKEKKLNENYIYKIKEIIGTNENGEKILIIWRNRTEHKDVDNKFIEEYFRKQRYNPLDMEFDKIYINGDNTLQNIKKDEEHWKVELIEEKFKKMMFGD